MKNPFCNLVSIPWVWNGVQVVLGAPEFKKKLYLSALTPGERLLDFGCASGHLAEAFKEFDYYGVDIDPDAIGAAQERYRAYSNMHFVAGDIRSNPFEPNFFDAVLFAATVHHLPDDLLKQILLSLHCTLKSGGVIHVFDPVFRENDRWIQRFFRRIDQGKFTRSTEEIIRLVEPLNLFTIGAPTYHPPYGALIQDCDFVHLPLTKR